MAKFWCIKCQAEVEHREYYCHSRCGNNCEAVCSGCNTTSLTTKVANPRDDDTAALKWATGEAQRRMKETGVNETMEIAVSRLDASGLLYDRIARYNPADVYAKFWT